MENETGALPPLIEWAVAARPLPGEMESGDLYVVKPFPLGVLVGAIDGLGHGPQAANSARIVVSTLETFAGEPVISLMKRCHESLRRMRGAAVTLASISAEDGSMTWLSVGNVEGLLLRRDPKADPAREYIVPRGGAVGEQLPPLHASTYPLRQGDILILATDGISHGFAERLNLLDSPQEIADSILHTHGKSTDDALVLVVRYIGRSS